MPDYEHGRVYFKQFGAERVNHSHYQLPRDLITSTCVNCEEKSQGQMAPHHEFEPGTL